MAEAGRRPRYYDPLLASAGDNGLLIAALLPGAMDSRNFVRALWARAMLRIQEGKIDETWADLLTCHRLGRHIGQGPTLDEWLVGITIDYVAQTGDQAILQHGKLTAAQLAKMRTELAQLPPMLKTADKVDMGERMMFLDAALAMAEGNTDSLVGFFAAYGPNESLAAKVKTAALASLDWDIVLRMSNTWYDRLTVAARKPTRAERVKAFAGFDAELKKLAESSRNPQTLGWALLGGQKAVSTQMGQMLVSLLLPVVSAVSGAEDRAAMQRAETDLAFALAQYRADHGAYPAKLADLAPKYVAKVPRDIFNNDADLKYHAENGSYLLYSFGLNGKDDGGKTNGEFSKSGPGDDVTVRMPAATK
jgi:hypothetical protein